jgi:hypothetical protein
MIGSLVGGRILCLRRVIEFCSGRVAGYFARKYPVNESQLRHADCHGSIDKKSKKILVASNSLSYIQICPDVRYLESDEVL